MKMPKPNISAAAMTVALLLTGCAFEGLFEPAEDPYVFHVMDDKLTRASAEGLDPEGPAVLIGKTGVTQHLIRPHIIVYLGGNRASGIGKGIDRWGEPIEEGVNRILSERLATGLDTSRVNILHAARGFEWDYRVGYQINRLGGVPGESVELWVTWWVRDADGETLLHENSLHAMPVDGDEDDAEAYVEAIRSVVTSWAEEVAASIRSL